MRLELGRLYHLTQSTRRPPSNSSASTKPWNIPTVSALTSRRRKLLLGDPPGECYELFGEAFLLSRPVCRGRGGLPQVAIIAPKRRPAEIQSGPHRRPPRPGGGSAGRIAAVSRHGLTSEGTAPYQFLADVLKKLGKKNELLDRLQKLHAADGQMSLSSYFLAGSISRPARWTWPSRSTLELSVHEPGDARPSEPLAEIYRKGRRPDKLLALLGKVMTATGERSRRWGRRRSSG